MKTSSSQFDLMVTFMEQDGDLSKPSSSARGRMNSIKNWEELARILNSDGSGDTKSTEKWKKVWSDFKNNTKKKAARLHRAASGTGGGPATYAKLSDLELRVLNLIGKQVATGLAVEEAGLSQGMKIQTTNIRQVVPVNEPEPLPSANVASPLPPSQVRPISSPSLMFTEQIEGHQPWNEAGPSTQCHIAPPSSPSLARPTASPLHALVESEENTGMLTPTRPSSQVHVVRPEPALSGQTTPRRARPTRGSPRRRLRPAHTEQAAQYFLQADENWRKFKIQQHQDYMDIRREQNRIREMEVQAQRDWQAVGLRALDMLDKLVDKYCKN